VTGKAEEEKNMAQNCNYKYTRLILLVLAVLFVNIGGCSSTAPSRFFQLSPVLGPESSAVNQIDLLTVGITQVGIPDYLNRPQIATRIGPNEIRYDEFNRWAGPLKENIARVLLANLIRLLGTERVVMDTWLTRVPVDYQVWVEVIRFDAGPKGDVNLTAKWALYRQDDTKLLITKLFDRHEAATADGYEAVALAGSRAMAALSIEIADAIMAAP